MIHSSCQVRRSGHGSLPYWPVEDRTAAGPFVLLEGGQIENKGDALMLLAVCDRLHQFNPNLRFVRQPWHGSYEERARMGFYQHSGAASRRLPFLRRWARDFARQMFKRYGSRYGLVDEEEVAAVIDFSGMKYTDAWGPDNTARQAQAIRRWARARKPIIMLPQTFGPFLHAESVAAAQTIVASCNRIYAREPASLEALTKVAGPQPHVRRSPDFTNLVKGIRPEYLDPGKRYAGICPNIWLTKKVDDDKRGKYFDCLATCVSLLEGHGLEPLIVLHAPFQDAELVPQLTKAIGKEVRVVREEHPVLLKGVIGSCELLVGSRFHALVGALSQEVPALGLGWAPKFGTLFDDYNCPEYMINALAPRELIANRIERALVEPARTELIERLRRGCKQQVRSVELMWGEVEDALTQEGLGVRP